MNIKELLGDSYKEGMTIAEVEEALSGKNLADLTTGEYVSIGKFKDIETKLKATDLKLRDRLTEDEKMKETQAAREEYVKSLEERVKLSEYKEKLSKSIKDENILNSVAEAFAKGDIAKAFDMQNEYISKERALLEKQIKTELLQNNPQPTPQNGTVKRKFKDFLSMPNGQEELDKIRRENPNLYSQILETAGDN